MREYLFRGLHWPRHARSNFSSTVANERPWNSIWSCQLSPHKCKYGQHVQSRDGQSPVRSDFLQHLYSWAVQYRSSRLFSARRWRWRGFVILLGVPQFILGIRWLPGLRREQNKDMKEHIPHGGSNGRIYKNTTSIILREFDNKIRCKHQLIWWSLSSDWRCSLSIEIDSKRAFEGDVQLVSPYYHG